MSKPKTYTIRVKKPPLSEIPMQTREHFAQCYGRATVMNTLDKVYEDYQGWVERKPSHIELIDIFQSCLQQIKMGYDNKNNDLQFGVAYTPSQIIDLKEKRSSRKKSNNK